MAVLYVIKQLSQQAVSTEVLKYVKNTGDSCLAVVAVLVLCMTVRVSFFHFISFHFISFHFISLIVLEIGGDYLKEPYDQSLSIDFAAFPAVLPDNGAYHKPIFHSTQFSSNLTKPHFDIFIN
jgi:hypothetical protein